MTRAREGGEATSYFCIARKCDSLAVFAVAYFDPHLAGCHLAAMGRAGDCVCRLQLWLVINILQNKVQFVQEAYLFIVYIYKLLSMSILHSQFFRVDHSTQDKSIKNKEFLFRLLLAADRELIISELNLYRLFPQYWLLIRNDPDALISAFPTIMIATGLIVLGSSLSIIIINYCLKACML